MDFTLLPYPSAIPRSPSSTITRRWFPSTVHGKQFHTFKILEPHLLPKRGSHTRATRRRFSPRLRCPSIRTWSMATKPQRPTHRCSLPRMDASRPYLDYVLLFLTLRFHLILSLLVTRLSPFPSPPLVPSPVLRAGDRHPVQQQV